MKGSKILAFLFVPIVIVAAIFWWLTRPQITDLALLQTPPSADPANGEKVFWASGCASCHAEKGAKGPDRLKLGGGFRLESPFGTFVTPNISPDPDTGIGKWSYGVFYNALKHGVSPIGEQLYPSFPYTTYVRMEDKDVADLYAFMKTLPAVSRANQPHELALPFRFRPGIGFWKLLFFNADYHLAVDTANKQLLRGRYLVEAMAHCAECHTPRNAAGGLNASQWLAGGPSPEGKGKIPNITPSKAGIGEWSQDDIVNALKTGFMPDFDSFGGSMVSVQENMAHLPDDDLKAIALYLKTVPALD